MFTVNTSQSVSQLLHAPLNPKKIEIKHGDPTIKWTSAEFDSFTQQEGLQYALIAKFSYGRPDIKELRTIFPHQLGIKGQCNIGLLDPRHVLIRLDLYDDFVSVYSKSVDYIKSNKELFLYRIFRWSPWFNPQEETSVALAWISLPKLPMNLFAREAIWTIASAVGTPIALDKATKDRTRPGTARVKVEVDLLKNLPERVRVECMFDTGRTREVIVPVVYDQLPEYCMLCKHQGHADDKCWSSTRKPKSDGNKIKANEQQTIITDAVIQERIDARILLNSKRGIYTDGQGESTALHSNQEAKNGKTLEVNIEDGDDSDFSLTTKESQLDTNEDWVVVQRIKHRQWTADLCTPNARYMAAKDATHRVTANDAVGNDSLLQTVGDNEQVMGASLGNEQVDRDFSKVHARDNGNQNDGQAAEIILNAEPLHIGQENDDSGSGGSKQNVGVIGCGTAAAATLVQTNGAKSPAEVHAATDAFGSEIGVQVKQLAAISPTNASTYLYTPVAGIVDASSTFKPVNKPRRTENQQTQASTTGRCEAGRKGSDSPKLPSAISCQNGFEVLSHDLAHPDVYETAADASLSKTNVNLVASNHSMNHGDNVNTGEMQHVVSAEAVPHNAQNTGPQTGLSGQQNMLVTVRAQSGNVVTPTANVAVLSPQARTTNPNPRWADIVDLNEEETNIIDKAICRLLKEKELQGSQEITLEMAQKLSYHELDILRKVDVEAIIAERTKGQISPTKELPQKTAREPTKPMRVQPTRISKLHSTREK